jgi:hypothetical protein
VGLKLNGTHQLLVYADDVESRKKQGGAVENHGFKYISENIINVIKLMRVKWACHVT